MEDDYGPSTSYRGRSYGRSNSYNRGRGGRSFDQDSRYYQAGRNNGRYSNGDGYRDERYNGGKSEYTSYRGRGGFGLSRGRGRGRGRGFQDPEDVQFLKILRGHEGSVTAMVFDEAGGQLFSGSLDRTVRVWDYNNGQIVKTVQVGGLVHSMLYEGGFLFVGLQMTPQQDLAAPSAVKVYHLQSGSEDTLDGLTGPVYALAAGNNMLFSGGHDTVIRMWEFSQEGGKFIPKVALGAAQDGHAFPVACLQIVGTFLFSADFKGNIKVWDLVGGVCTQTITNAHENVILSLIPYKSHMLSGSVDGSIRVWQHCEPPAPGAVVHPQPAYVHPPPGHSADFGKILALCGALAPDNQDILLSSCSKDETIRLWQLPDFTDRGHLNAIRNCRAVICGQGHIFAGDYDSGNIKVWKWASK